MGLLHDAQITEVEKLYIQLAKERNVEIKASQIAELRRVISSIASPVSIFKGFEIQEYSKFPIDKFNVSLNNINTDNRTLLTFLKSVYIDIQQLESISKILGLQLQNLSQRTLIELAPLIQGEIDGISTNVPLKEVIDLSRSKVEFNNSEMVIPVKSRYVVKKAWTDQDIKITVNGKGIISNSFIGNRSNPFNLQNPSMFVAQILTDQFTNVRLDIDLSMDSKAINRIYLSFGEELVNSKITIFGGTSPDKRTELGSTVITNHETFIRLNSTEQISHIRIAIESSLGRRTPTDDIIYNFPIKRIEFSRESTSESLNYISKDIELGRKASIVSLVTDENLPDGTITKYYLNPGSDPDVGWIEIEPINRTKKKNNIINLGQIRGKISKYGPDNSNPMNDWDIDTISTQDIKLYNILSLQDYDEGGILTAKLGTLSPSDGEIVEESIKVYRGIDDYSIRLEQPFTTETTAPVVHKAIANTSVPGYEPISILVNYIEIIKPSSSDPTQVLLKHEITDSTSILIKDADNVIIGVNALTLTSIGDRTQITFDRPLDPTQSYTITYDVKLSEVNNKLSEDKELKILEPTFEIITNEGVLLNNRTDFVISNENQTLYLDRNLQNIESLQIKVDWIVRYIEKIQIYETHLYNDSTINLQILGFSDNEIDKGNFHWIDNQNVSRLTEIELSPGHHIIKTTQPYPSDPNNPLDVNGLTNQGSLAGIIIPDGIYYRAFEDSLRQISFFQLGNNISPNNQDNFSLLDSKIWLNRKPLFLRQNLLNDSRTNHIKGTQLLGKKAIMIGGIFDHYESQPELFDIESAIQTPELPDKVKLKIVGSVTDSAIDRSISIRKVLINNLTLQ